MNTNILADLIEDIEEYLSHECDMQGECSIEHALANRYRFTCSKRRKLHAYVVRAHETHPQS